MGQQNRRSQAKSKAPEYNIWRVLFVFIEGFFNLINNKQIYPAMGFIILTIMGLIVWRLPDNELAEIVKLLINEFIVGKGTLIALIVITNLGWVYLLKRTTNVYQREIDRLAAIRSDLMHNPNRKNIENHRSTNGDCEESYIVPDTPDAADKDTNAAQSDQETGKRG